MPRSNSKFGFSADMFEHALEPEAWQAIPASRVKQAEASEHLADLARNVASYQISETLTPSLEPSVEQAPPVSIAPASPTAQWKLERPGDLFAVFSQTCPPSYLEQFQLLRTQLLLLRSQCNSDDELRCVCLTSAVKGEGKSFTARNLAATLASASGKKVLLVEAGRRNFSIPDFEGNLEIALTDPANWRECTVEIATSSLSILPGTVGRAADFEPLPALIAQLKPHFDWIVIDAPAIHDAAAAEWVIASADAALLVVRQGETTFDRLNDASARIPRGRLAGVVMNKIPAPVRRSFFPRLPTVRIRLSRAAKAS